MLQKCRQFTAAGDSARLFGKILQDHSSIVGAAEKRPVDALRPSLTKGADAHTSAIPNIALNIIPASDWLKKAGQRVGKKSDCRDRNREKQNDESSGHTDDYSRASAAMPRNFASRMLPAERSARNISVFQRDSSFCFSRLRSLQSLFLPHVVRFFQPNPRAGMMFSAMFGIALVWASAPLVRRGTQRIDRAFFRSAYDARMILQDLAEKARTVTSRGELAALLKHHLDKALHPKNFVCYFAAGDSKLVAECGNVRPGGDTLNRFDDSCVAHFAREILDVPLPGEEGMEDLAVLAPLAPECLVPILDHAGQLSGLLVLGSAFPRSRIPVKTSVCWIRWQPGGYRD